jgi:DNA-binding NarL/FixJ family response regulator
VERSSDQGWAEGRSEEPATARVLIVEDHAILAHAIADVLSGEPGIAVCGTVGSAAEAVSAALTQAPNVVLLAYRLPGVGGLAAAGLIRTAAPGAAIVFHTADDSEGALLDAIDAGASGFLTRSASSGQIIDAVRLAARGEVPIPAALFAKAIARQRVSTREAGERAQLFASFTPRELQILRLLADGLDTTAMADRLAIADHTVEWHVRHVIEKLQVHSKLQAVVAAARLGIIEL